MLEYLGLVLAPGSSLLSLQTLTGSMDGSSSGVSVIQVGDLHGVSASSSWVHLGHVEPFGEKNSRWELSVLASQKKTLALGK